MFRKKSYAWFILSHWSTDLTKKFPPILPSSPPLSSLDFVQLILMYAALAIYSMLRMICKTTIVIQSNKISITEQFSLERHFNVISFQAEQYLWDEISQCLRYLFIPYSLVHQYSSNLIPYLVLLNRFLSHAFISIFFLTLHRFKDAMHYDDGIMYLLLLSIT